MSDTTPSPTMNLPGPITLYTEQDSYNFSAPQQPGRLSIDPSFPYTDMDQSRMESTFDNGYFSRKDQGMVQRLDSPTSGTSASDSTQASISPTSPMSGSSASDLTHAFASATEQSQATNHIFRELLDQRPYQSNQPTQGEPRNVYFFTKGIPGFSILDAIKMSYTDLDNRDDPMLVGCIFAASISVRLELNGYPSWSRQVRVMDHKKDSNPVSREKLANLIAKSVETCIKDHQNRLPNGPAVRVGPGFIEARDLVLIGLNHVSKASFQPILAFA